LLNETVCKIGDVRPLSSRIVILMTATLIYTGSYMSLKIKAGEKAFSTFGFEHCGPYVLDVYNVLTVLLYRFSKLRQFIFVSPECKTAQ